MSVSIASTFSDTDITNGDVLDYSVVSSVSELNATVSGTSIILDASTSFTGNATITVVAADHVRNLVSTAFNVTATACPQDNCNGCSGNGTTSCTSCESGYSLSAGTCIADCWDCYLTRDVNDAGSRAVVGTSVAAAAAGAVAVSAVTATAPMVVGSAIGQTQAAQIMCLFNTNLTDSYIEYCQSYSVTKLDFEFMDFIGAREGLADETERRLQATGYTNLSNIRLGNGSFLVNYIYWIILIPILILIHIIVWVIANSMKESEGKMGRCMRATKRAFEFAVYFYLLVFSSSFLFLVTVNEIAGGNLDTGVTSISFFMSLIVITVLFTMMAFPVLMALKERSSPAAVSVEGMEAHASRNFIQKIWANYKSGFKDTLLARIFYTVLLGKFFLYSLNFIFVDSGVAQIILFLIITGGFAGYLAVARPFKYLIQNILFIVNELVLVFIGFLMFGFVDNDDPSEGLADFIMLVFTVDILASFAVGFAFQAYLLGLKMNTWRNGVAVISRSNSAKRGDTERQNDETEQRINKGNHGSNQGPVPNLYQNEGGMEDSKDNGNAWNVPNSKSKDKQSYFGRGDNQVNKRTLEA